MRGAHDYSHDDRKSRYSSRTKDNKARFYSYCARHKDERSIRPRLYFKGKQAKKKGFSALMGAQQLTESTASHCLSGSDAKQCMNTFRCSPIDA